MVRHLEEAGFKDLLDDLQREIPCERSYLTLSSDPLRFSRLPLQLKGQVRHFETSWLRCPGSESCPLGGSGICVQSRSAVREETRHSACLHLAGPHLFRFACY
jgi:hypothetical protein